jgi:hypothetical protein
MMNSRTAVQSLSSSQLLSATRELVQKSRGTDADLLEHLGEIDERRLYLDGAFPSMFAFCIGEYGFSEDVAYQRIAVARAARSLPAILEAIRSGRVHMTGLRLLAPHLNTENIAQVLAEATGKSTRQIEELVARLAPQPPVPTVIRKLPAQVIPQPPPPTLFGSAETAVSHDSSPATASGSAPASVAVPRRDEQRCVVQPLAEETFKFQFTASRACRDKLRQAQDLLRHRVPDGDVGTIVEKALDALIERVTKERFAEVRKSRKTAIEAEASSVSRHIPSAIKRAVFERDGGRCTFTDERGRRCGETGGLEFDHLDGFARTHLHDADRIRLLCRSHNQYAAERMYGRGGLQRARASRDPRPTLPGISR